MPQGNGPRYDAPERGPKPSFVELPAGLFTAAGTWFHVTVADLEAYAGPLLERIPVHRLIDDAESVLRSAQTFATWMLLGALLLATPIEAAVAALLIFVGWSVVGPGLVVPGLVPVTRVLETVWLQGGAYVAGLSLLGTADDVTAVVVGLAGFVLLRWGLVARAVAPVLRPIRERLYPLPIEDQVLRAVIIRHALRERVTLPQIGAIEERMLRTARGRSRDTKADS